MKETDYGRGQPDRPLKKKHVRWWANMVLKYAHRGQSLDYMLHQYLIRRSDWDAYVRKHKMLQLALQDAVHRAKGKAFEDLHDSRHSTNPALMKVYLANILGWSDKNDAGNQEDKPAPQVTVNVHPSANGKGKSSSQHVVSQDGQLIGQSKKKGNGKGNGSS